MTGARFVLLAMVLRAAPSAADSLCKGDEQPIFSCAAKPDGKYLSVCLASSTLSYRVGRAGKIELEIPAAAAELKREVSAYPEGVDYAILFRHGEMSYRIEDEEAARHMRGSAAWVEVKRSGKRVATLDCAPGWKQQWKLLDGIVPISSTAVDEPRAAPPTAVVKSKTAPNAIACGSPAPLAGLRKQIAEQFRVYAEKRHPFYPLAVEEFGAPQSCAVTEEDVPRRPDKPGEPTRVDESNFAGTLVYSFKGATLTLTSRYRVEALLTAPEGFKNTNAALTAAQEAAKVSFRTVRSTIIEDENAGTKTETFSSDADDSGTAELTTRGEKLIAIHAR
jgi:hypothetical protein